MKLNKLRRGFISFILLTVCILSFQVLAFATDTNKFVKVGLTREQANKTQITINNKDISIGYNYENFSTLPLNLTATNNFVAKPVTGYFVQLPETATTKEELVALQNIYSSLGFVDTVIYVTNNNEYSLLVGSFDSTMLAQISVETLSTLGKASSIISVNQKIGLQIDDKIGVVFGNETLKPQVTTYVSNTYMNISSNLNYRGAIQFNIVNGYVQPVNVVALEQYLYGLVPSEMPSGWHPEALKAQAVAARTYGYSALGVSKHSTDGYNLCDSTHCQVYKGINNEAASTSAAVDATKGIVAYNGNSLIEALFSSSNGGSTANSEDVWAATIPYLRAKADPYENGVMQWTRQFTQAELTSLVLAKQANLGVVQSVKIDQTDSFGRAVSLTFVCSNGNYTIKKDAMRSFFSSTPDGSLKSTNFKITSNLSTTTSTTNNSKNIDDLTIYSNGQYVDYTGDMTIVTSNGIATSNSTSTNVIDSTGKVTNYTQAQTATSGNLVLSGAGWGHGVGLSQHGAKGMAEQGFTYDKILSFYYTGVELK